eukprot:1327721-Rhodomonas_salina.1
MPLGSGLRKADPVWVESRYISPSDSSSAADDKMALAKAKAPPPKQAPKVDSASTHLTNPFQKQTKSDSRAAISML